MNLRQKVSELERKFRCLNIRGTVEKINPEMGIGGCVRVRYGDDQLSDWLPVKPLRSGSACLWWFPDVGEGVTVTDIETGEVLPGSFIGAAPPPTRDPDVLFIQFGDGGSLSHNRETGVFDLNVNTDVNINTGSKVNITTGAEVNVITEKATITAPTIESTGAWSHTGPMQISETLVVTGVSTLTGTVAMMGGFTSIPGAGGGAGGKITGGLEVLNSLKINDVEVFNHNHAETNNGIPSESGVMK